jgi:hypothetical protein
MTSWNGFELTLAPDETHTEYWSPFATAVTNAETLPLAHESTEQAAVRTAIAAGTTDIGTLTNQVFLARHPERAGRAISATEPGAAALGAEWVTIRDTVVKPLMATAPAAAGEMWVPGAERVKNPRPGGSYDKLPWRFVFHTTEGEPSAAAFRKMAATHANPPHLWASPKDDLLLQTLSLHRSAYALLRPTSLPTNTANAIQVEVAGYAAKMGDAPPETLRWLAERVLAPVARMVPLNLNRVSPQGPGEPCFGVNSLCRMTAAEWTSFDGVTGHRNVTGNEHWDPGRLRLEEIARIARELLASSPPNYLQREQDWAPHDGPNFVGERDDEDTLPAEPRWLELPAAPWLAEPGAAREMMPGQEGSAEQLEVESLLAHQEAPGRSEDQFPSGVRLRTVTAPSGPNEDYWDPYATGVPLYDTSESQRALALSTNFVVGEFVYVGGMPSDIARISGRLIRQLQKIRDHVAQPLSVTSGYRSFRANIELYTKRGEKPINSYHSSGRAADVSTAGMSGLDIAKLAITLCGPNIAVGVSTSYAHVDVRGEWARWTYFEDPAEDARVKAALDAHRQSVLSGPAIR